MRSVLPMKAAKIGYIILSVLYCVLGILLITMPELSITALGILLGIGMIVFGIVKIVGYFSKDLFRLAFQYDLAFGASAQLFLHSDGHCGALRRSVQNSDRH